MRNFGLGTTETIFLSIPLILALLAIYNIWFLVNTALAKKNIWTLIVLFFPFFGAIVFFIVKYWVPEWM